MNRRKIIASHNPVLVKPDYHSPLSVGNGDFCFTADITGFQSLSELYEDHDIPLCIMSSWGWHTEPFSSELFSPSRDDIQLTTYGSLRGTQKYAVEKFPGNEKIYNWFRENPHRLNLGCISLKENGKKIMPESLSHIRQELHLYDGYIESIFVYKTILYTVYTVCDSETHSISFFMEAKNPVTHKEVPIHKSISVEIDFPYGSPKKEASVWDVPAKHKTKTHQVKKGLLVIERNLDNDTYYVNAAVLNLSTKVYDGEHKIVFLPCDSTSSIECSFTFSPDNTFDQLDTLSFTKVCKNASGFWQSYWEKGGFIDFSKSSDIRSFELERRIILSQYLLVIQSCGSMPPQETGLTCNSWYGKFHLEMYPLHTAWAALWGHEELLEKSLSWFLSHLDKAIENAQRNNFSGARWPKMIGPDAVDSPSPIATLLIWQQPHILYLLELVYKTGKGRDFLQKYRDCVFETAEFMADYVFFDANTETWNIESPVIPVQEEHKPQDVKNPAFEVEYWRFGLLIAAEWITRLGEKVPPQWMCIAHNMAPMPFHEGLYTAHDNCPQTFYKYNKDHPSMLMSFGFIPNDRIDNAMMERTLQKVMACWDYESLWGWDFAVMALTAQRIGNCKCAVDLLLKDTPKNTYVTSGNNRQSDRKDLPLYLPGNGSLLLAAAHLAVSGAFSQNGWNAEYENIRPLYN